MKRVLAATIGLIAGATFLMACSDDDGGDSSGGGTTAAVTTTVTGESGQTEVTTGGGDTKVTVNGEAVEGLDLDSVTCAKQGGKIMVGSGTVNGQEALAVVMSDEDSPKVESLGIVVDGTALAVSSTMGMDMGSADVVVDGDTYTITGQAQGADMSNPTEGMVKKDFSITVTCD